jgi:hypothetical protein
MTYTELISLIQSTCEIVSDGTFRKGRRPDASFASVNDINFPLMFLYYPDFSTVNRTTENVRVSMLFVKQDDPNTSEEDKQTIHNDMKILCDKFFIELIKQIETPGNDYFGKAIYNYDRRQTIEDKILAGTFSGVGVSFTLTTKLKQC